MKLVELFHNIEYTAAGSAVAAEVDVSYICYDSRRASSGALFVALSGSHADGHNYTAGAYNLGCRAFLCEHLVDLPQDATVFITPNTRAALAYVSQSYFGHPEEQLKLIGITGTKGKTSAALMICDIMNAAGHRCGYIGSNGVEFAGRHFLTENTTPESYDIARFFSLMVEAGVTHVVLEVSSQALSNYRVTGLTFEVCGFTNLYHDHIGHYEHPTFEHYRAAKRTLFADYGAKYIAYSTDDPAAGYMTDGSGALLAGYSITGKAEYYATDIERYSTVSILGVSFVLHTVRGSRKIILPTPGSFSVYNALCAIAITSYYGISEDIIAEALASCTPKGRFEVVRALSYATFIIDYAHNGISLRHALSVIREYNPKRLVCLFGSVGGRTETRRQELAEVAGELADYCIITSDNPDGEKPEKIIAEIESFLLSGKPHVCITSRRDAVRYAVEHAEEGDVVLLAGKGHENYQLVHGEKIPFSERELLLEFAREYDAQHAFGPESERQYI